MIDYNLSSVAFASRNWSSERIFTVDLSENSGFRNKYLSLFILKGMLYKMKYLTVYLICGE